ncbi:MAG: glycosyltransferase family 4 protein [Chitinophagaceae bacterium]|nr:glycosyltransferase family 4 protein [Chitinophagaceae bacterium]
MIQEPGLQMKAHEKEIILDCDLMKYPHSGLYHYCLNLGLSVQSLLENEKDISISFYVPPSEARSFGAGARHIVERRSFWNILNPFQKHCHIWHAPFQSGRIFPDKKKYPNIRVLLTIHDLNPLHEGKPEKEKQKNLLHTQSLIDKSDAIVCISEFCKKDVLQNCETGGKPVYVIHNGMHKVHLPGLNGKTYKPSRPFLFGMGYVNAKKNYHVLLPLLKNEQVEMVIAGKLDDPEYIEAMKKQALQMGVDDRLHIVGPVSEAEKAWYFQNCFAFVHPSLAEGFGAPVVEAMQFGKPLFLSSLTSLPEIGGNAAFYFSSFDPDHMCQVFEQGMTRYENENMSQRIIKRGQLFNWEEKAKQYLEVYRSLF